MTIVKNVLKITAPEIVFTRQTRKTITSSKKKRE